MEAKLTRTKVTEKDVAFLEKELRKKPRPLLLDELTKKLAYYKSADQLSEEVKKYDPESSYEIGDSIYKEYNEPLLVSSKGAQHFQGAIVLKVINKEAYENFNCEMLEVDYAGGGLFRKYIDYMKKTKTQVLLPSNLEGKAKVPEKMKKEEDPRLDELPMTDRDIKTLEKNLKLALSKSSKFINWNQYWQLAENQVEIKDKKIKEIEKHLLENKKSVETTALVNKLFGLSPSDDHFEIHCLSLNHVLEKKHKKDFVFVAPYSWGKWHLKKYLNSLLSGLPLSAPSAKLPAFEEEEKPEKVQLQTDSLKIYLTWREIFSGGIKTPKALTRELSSCREYVFTDVEGGKDYTLHFYPTQGFFLGLKDFYEQNNVPQGASLTLERKEGNQFNFWLKKSKKKLSVFKITYDPKEDKFEETGEELFSYSLPNKIIHIEKETFSQLASLYAQRNKSNLRELLILIYKNFGLEGDNYALHSLRAYHLVDILKRTSQEDVEITLLNSPEFKKSSKKKGVFFYQEKIEIEEEEIPEAAPEVPVEAPPVIEAKEIPPEKEIPVEAPLEEEMPPATMEVKAEEVAPEVREPAIDERIPLEEPPEKEKVKISKKKRQKMERERGPRLRTREKRFIEEKIEIEESELEALTAVKEKREEVKVELPPKEKKEVPKKPAVSEEPAFGLFAEKLKTALDKQKKDIKKK
ncbi:MAG: hypothetical protein GTO17_09765 [Candidatus Aminicenantes bacterium]|nr:hypothetical protein [Candidatus Aminicenantes bacterium]